MLCSQRTSFLDYHKRAVSLGLGANDREVIEDVIPPYPPGPTRWYKQAASGLYGGQMVQFGNNTNEKKTKTRRTWSLNVRNKKLFSKALNRTVQIRVTTRVLRTIDKLGGLDEYLLGEKSARIKELGEAGWWLRWAIMQTKPIQERFEKERQALGLPPAAGTQGEEVPQHETSSAEEPQPSDAAERNLVLDSLEGNKQKLTFRVDKIHYVKLVDGEWCAVKSKRAVLKGIALKISPTVSLQEWERLEVARSDANQTAYPESIKMMWFGSRRKDYERLQTQIELVDPAEAASDEDLLDSTRLHESDMTLQQWAELDANPVADAEMAQSNTGEETTLL